MSSVVTPPTTRSDGGKNLPEGATPAAAPGADARNGDARAAETQAAVSDAGAPSTSAAKLRITDGAGSVAEVALAAPRSLVGRAQDVRVKLDSGMVSRHHAELTLDPAGRWVVRDMHSRNGTMVNGSLVAAPRPLEPGDRIGVGPYTLTFVPPENPAAPEPAARPRLLVSDLEAGRISTLEEVEPPRLAAAHLTTLCDFGRDLLSTGDPAERLRSLCRLMTGPNFHALWAYALRLATTEPETPPTPLCDPQRAEDSATCEFDSATSRAFAARIGPASPNPPDAKDPQGMTDPSAGAGDASAYISRGVLRAVRHKGEAVLAGNTGRAGQLEVSLPSSVLPVAAVAVPIHQGAATLDVLYVTFPPDCGTGEWLALTMLAAKQYQQAEDAWAARRQAEASAAARAAFEFELERARQIQMRLVPRASRVPGLDLAIGFAPCRCVGGDYVDVVPMKDGRTLLVVADVCGKGLPAALVTSSLHTMVHTCLDAGMTLAALAACLNRYLGQTLADDSFVTMVAVALDPGTGAFECVNAGHPPALLLTPGGEHQELQWAVNFPLSCEEADPVPQSGQMEPGQLLCLYTDGLTELPEGERPELGTDGLCRRLKSIYSIHPAPPPAARDVADGLTHQLNSLQGRGLPDDDRTFLLAKRE